MTVLRSAHLDLPSGPCCIGAPADRLVEEDLGELAPGASVCLADGLSPTSDPWIWYAVRLHGRGGAGTTRELRFSVAPGNIPAGKVRPPGSHGVSRGRRRDRHAEGAAGGPKGGATRTP